MNFSRENLSVSWQKNIQIIRISASNGGELKWFGSGEMIPAFSEAAFAISDTGKYSKPVRTLYGWHIIKLLEKKHRDRLKNQNRFLKVN